jgi:DNA invertase Pin-like site-specific DNA recombinase
MWRQNLNKIPPPARQKVSLHFVDVGGEVTGTDAMGSVLLKLLSVFAEFYAKQVSEK